MESPHIPTQKKHSNHLYDFVAPVPSSSFGVSSDSSNNVVVGQEEEEEEEESSSEEGAEEEEEEGGEEGGEGVEGEIEAGSKKKKEEEEEEEKRKKREEMEKEEDGMCHCAEETRALHEVGPPFLQNKRISNPFSSPLPSSAHRTTFANAGREGH